MGTAERIGSLSTRVSGHVAIPADPDRFCFTHIAFFLSKPIKGDFSGLVTSQPAPRDIVYVYMTGLGHVQGPVQTGVPAPVDSLRPIVNTLTCTFMTNFIRPNIVCRFSAGHDWHLSGDIPAAKRILRTPAEWHAMFAKRAGWRCVV